MQLFLFVPFRIPLLPNDSAICFRMIPNASECFLKCCFSSIYIVLLFPKYQIFHYFCIGFQHREEPQTSKPLALHASGTAGRRTSMTAFSGT